MCPGPSACVMMRGMPANMRFQAPLSGMVVMFVSMCSFGIVSSNFWTLAQNVAPRTKVARVIGFLNTASQVAGIAAPWITGYIIGPAKHFAPAVAIAGVCPLVSLVPLFMASRGMERLRTELGQV